MADISDIKKIAKELCLMNIANGIIELKEETVSNLDYLYNVLNKEKELREQKKANDVYRSSRLPKKVFDETAITAGLRWQLEEIQKIDFKNQKQNIVIVGDVATGKTSLATKLAKEAIERKAVAVYTTEEDLLIAVRQQKSHWNKIMHSDLIVLDELFYLKPTEENMALLYKTVMFLSEKYTFPRLALSIPESA